MPLIPYFALELHDNKGKNMWKVTHFSVSLPVVTFGQCFNFPGTFCDVKQLVEDISVFTQHRGVIGGLKYTSRGKQV